MRRLTRWLQRLFVFALVAVTLWFIVTQIFDRLEERLPWFAALLGTYILAAYVVLPIVIHACVAALRGNRIPRVTRAADGLPADPVNVILMGSKDQLTAAFSTANWHPADPLTPRTAVRMATSFLLNRPYSEAPFSSLYLFGRKQDIGFQEPVGNSPRKRHHIRFWAADTDPEAHIGNLAYWTKRARLDLSSADIWIGAGTTDTGFGFQSMTWQISHRVDKYADRERDYVIAALHAAGCIEDQQYIEAGEPTGNRFISDGRIVRANLAEPTERFPPTPRKASRNEGDIS